MAILEGDIKLLASSVMTDDSDGGGQMTGTVIVDGASNNIFPDTSALDRALGRFNARKVFGVAQSLDTDKLLGAHAIVTAAPADPNTAVTLVGSSSWAEQRSVLQERVEKYMVKGPRYGAHILDIHYAGSSLLRMWQEVGAEDFPVAGDAVAIRNPNGAEQYVRLQTLKSSVTQTVAVGLAQVKCKVNTYELAVPLTMDVLGPVISAGLVNETASAAVVYSTVNAAGANFYGIKTLGASASTGALKVTTNSGIYNSIVPSTTIESAVTDQQPYKGLAALSDTANALVNIVSASNATLSAGSVIYLPTAAKAGTIAFTHGATSFTDSNGVFLQGTTAVGTVDYTNMTITMSSSSPSYGSAAWSLTYKPATASGVFGYSDEVPITLGNQGTTFTASLAPIPAPGATRLSYMVAGRWYTLTDNSQGKLSGADASYGIGTISYSTGSASVTLGAIPDVGSVLLWEWGDGRSAVSPVYGSLPTKLFAKYPIPANANVASMSLTWSRGATNYTASVDTAGILSGDATGYVADGVLNFAPTAFPDSSVAVSHKLGGASTAFSGSGLAVTLTNTEVVPGTFKSTAIITLPADSAWTATTTSIYDKGDGIVYAYVYNGASDPAVGTINYTTGVVTLLSSAQSQLYCNITETVSLLGGGGGSVTVVKKLSVLRTIGIAGMGGSVSYNYKVSNAIQNTSFTPSAWVVDTGTGNDATLSTHLSDVVFKVGGDLYSAQGGIVRKGWTLSTGVPTVVNSGFVNSSGLVSITSLPTNGVNSITWYNLAQDTSGKMTSHGVFRTAAAPIKAGNLQIALGALAGTGNTNNTITGTITGSVDYARGIVRWSTTNPASAYDMRYNTVVLQYLPLDAATLGLDTTRLPLDGKVPIFRKGNIVVVHNTQSYTINSVTKGQVYNIGRVRLAAVKVKDSNGATVDTTQYTTDLDAGTIVFPVGSNLTPYTQPFYVKHRVEDVKLCSIADISGDLTFTSALTHDFPANTSFVSSALVVGDVFARAKNSFEQGTWTGVWSDTLIGSAPATANFDETNHPIVVNNKGAINERWAVIFTNTTAFKVVGETLGTIATGNTSTDCAPVNSATGEPYFSIPHLGWGSDWAVGNVYRFNTQACGSPLWVVRTVLQGPATVQDDSFEIAFRGDVDRV